MAVFRIEKTRDYTVMSNHHLRNAGLSLKSKGLLSMICLLYTSKMEQAIKKLPGVRDASVSFLTQKLTLDADDARFDAIVQEVVNVCKKVEPDCVIHV